VQDTICRASYSTYRHKLLECIDLCSGGVEAVALEEGEEVAREKSIQLQEEVVDRDIQMHYQLIGGQACSIVHTYTQTHTHTMIQVGRRFKKLCPK